jgi:hypothetical protein
MMADKDKRQPNPNKRCAICKVSRAEGAVIGWMQSYCNLCHAERYPKQRKKQVNG